MRADFDAALKAVFANEGGYVNNPHDPGGATCFGITQRVFLASGGSGSVRNITRDFAASIYRQQYANAIRFDDLPAGLDLCALDEAVNSGVVRGVKDLQRVVGVRPDGHIGVLTMAAMPPDSIRLRAAINRMCDDRLSFLRALTNWRYFGGGWKARVTRTRAAALAMVPA